MIFSKADASTSDYQVDKLIRDFNINYGACIGSLIYLLSTKVDFIFAVQKLERFSSNTGKVKFEGLVKLLRYIRCNKTLGLNHYNDMEDVPLSDLLRKVSIKTENQMMAFYDSSWKYCPDTVRSVGAYIIFYKSGPIDHGTHVSGPVSQSNVERE